MDIPVNSEGLHEIANTANRDRKADIVFVHGLGGASHTTWRYGKKGTEGHFFWPEELGKDLPDCGIWTLGYPAGFTALGKPGMIIEKRAGNLSQKLANAGLGMRLLLFITHSMGGLVVKSLIVESQTLAGADRKRLVSMIRGIVFCSTPHRGSAFADAAGVLGKYFGGSQAHVKEMRANAEPLDILHDKFIEWQHKSRVPVESFAENIGLFRTQWWRRPLPLGLVVPRASANPGIAGHTVRDVDDDHLTLVKPANRTHDVYAGVLRFIRDALAEDSSQRVEVTPAAGPPLVPVTQAAQGSTRPFDGTQTILESGPIQGPNSQVVGTAVNKDSAGPPLQFNESMEANSVSVVLALERLRRGDAVEIRWPEASDLLLASAERVVIDASNYTDPKSAFHGWNEEAVSTFLDRMTVSAARDIRAGRLRVERRLVHLVQGAAPYFGAMGERLNEIVRNYLTLANYILHQTVAYHLAHNQLPPGMLPRIWDELVDAETQRMRGGIRRLFHINDTLIHARVRRFSGRDWNDYYWGPIEIVREAVKPGAFGTDWCVKYLIPQLELMLAQTDSSEVVLYEEGVTVDKATLLEHGQHGELDPVTLTER